MVPHTILLEPLSECLVLGILAAWSISFLFWIDPFAIYLFHVLVWFLLDYMLLNVIQVRFSISFCSLSSSLTRSLVTSLLAGRKERLIKSGSVPHSGLPDF